MPSRRRAFSSPSVRSSPYQLSPSPSPRTRTGAHRRRRSSPTETTTRRVLADIEWWRVLDGQCALDDRDNDNNRTVLADLDLEPPLRVTEHFPFPPIPQTPISLSVPTFYDIPHTPTRRYDSSNSSSLTSSPDSSPTSFETLRLGIENLDLRSSVFPPSPILAPTRPVSPYPSPDSIWSLDEKGRLTDLTLSPFSAYLPDPFN